MNKNRSILRSSSLQTLLSSLICIVLGLLVGYLVLLLIEPSGAAQAVLAVLKNFFKYPTAAARIKYFGNTLVKTAPLIMCSLSVLFAYKVGLFNIGVAGQYVLGAGAALYSAIILGLPWWACLTIAIAAGALSGVICGVLRSYANVNVVISGIMLNWISLYLTNLMLKPAMDPSGKDTFRLIKSGHENSILPTMGLDKLFGNSYVTIALPLTILVAVGVWVLLEKTKFGYELKATGNNLNAAKYCGMAENRNMILTMAIAGGLAAMGAALYYLTDFEQWNVNASSLPGMGFNGIAAAFLGGLHPIGAIFSSYFIQHITMGGGYVDLSHYCAQIADLITSVIIYLCGFVLFIKTSMNAALDRSDEKKAAKAAAAKEKEGDK